MPTMIELNHKWHLGDLLGTGGMGHVYEAHSKAIPEAVVKLIPKVRGADRELLFVELDGARNVVPVIDHGESGDHWVIVMPKAEISLRDYLDERGSKLAIADAVNVLADISAALASLNGEIVHRDIKPANILLYQGTWCLADFGIARYAEATTAPDTLKYWKTPQYAAPEQWTGERATAATDVYSTGIVAYELITGRVPFEGPEDHEFREQHIRETPDQVREAPLRLRSLIAQCLYKDPQARPVVEDLLRRLDQQLGPSTGARHRLQQANALAVNELTRLDRQKAVAIEEARRMRSLYKAAQQSHKLIGEMLDELISTNASAALSLGPRRWMLNNAVIELAPPTLASLPAEDVPYIPTFKVIGYSNITLTIPQDRYGYCGRSHSLWYCDAQDEGRFRWFETAFMSLGGARSKYVPFALAPDSDSYLALAPVVDITQAAWPFTPIDQGDEDSFVERWLGWFADAAQNNIRRPSLMPEQDPRGSYREVKLAGF